MAKRRKTSRAARRIYDNCLALAPDGRPLFRCTERRGNSYLQKGLAVREGDGQPMVIRLTFNPSGPGAGGDEYLLQPLPNLCVVCGSPENLSRHHVVPACYRRWFPPEAGYLTNFDLVALCLECHDRYEREARRLKRELEDEFEVPEECRVRRPDPRLCALRSHATALLKYLGQMPPERIHKCLETVRSYFGRPRITRDDLIEAALVEVHPDQGCYMTPGEVIVRRLKEPELLDRFARRWREHFLRHMRPRHLAPGWETCRPAAGSLLPPISSEERQKRKTPPREKARERQAGRRERLLRGLTKPGGTRLPGAR